MNTITAANITDRERNNLEDMMVYSEYSEPGYSTDKDYIILGDWNAENFDAENVDFLAILDELEEIAELEWSDEWLDCQECGKLVRVNPNSYGWTPYYYIFACELVCWNCIKDTPEDYLSEHINNPERAVTANLDLEKYGFTCLQSELENGLHKHMNDDPKTLKNIVPADNDFIYQLDAASQFHITFSLWIRPKNI